MSSILKALKRIEGQSPPPQSFPALPDSIDAKQAVNSKARRNWLLRRSIVVGLILLVITGTAVVVLRGRQSETAKIIPAKSPAVKQNKNMASVEKSKIYRAKIPSTAVKRTPGKSKQTMPARHQAKPVAAEPKAKKFRRNASSSESGAAVGQPISKARPAISTKRPQSRTSSSKSERKPSSRQKLRPSRKSIAGKRSAARKPAKPATAVQDKKATTYAKLTDSKLKLQALAWSGDVARRMAVINGRIVREGESVDGYQIDQIRQEDVVVSDGRKSWRLEFGLKQ